MSKSPVTSLRGQIERETQGQWGIFAWRLWVPQVHTAPRGGPAGSCVRSLRGQGLFWGLPDSLLLTVMVNLMILAIIIIGNTDWALSLCRAWLEYHICVSICSNYHHLSSRLLNNFPTDLHACCSTVYFSYKLSREILLKHESDHVTPQRLSMSFHLTLNKR